MQGDGAFTMFLLYITTVTKLKMNDKLIKKGKYANPH